MSEDERNRQLLKDIDEAIPKYQKTLDRLQKQRDFFESKGWTTLVPDIEDRMLQIHKVINNLEIAKKVYSKPETEKAKAETEKIKDQTESAIKTADEEVSKKTKIDEIYEEVVKKKWQKLFIGIGIGIAVGFVTDYILRLTDYIIAPITQIDNSTRFIIIIKDFFLL